MRLYFAEIYTAITGPGLRLFDVDINGARVLSNFDLWSQAGLNKGYVKEFIVSSHSPTMTISFGHEVENPFISAIEILSPNNGATAVTPTRRPERIRLAVVNPVRGVATIRVSMGVEGHVRLGIFDVTGHLVSMLVDGDLPVGEHTAVWNGTDRTGQRVAAGVYFVRLVGGGYSETRRLVLLR